MTQTLKHNDSIRVNYGVFKNVKARVNWVSEGYVWLKDVEEATTLDRNVPLSWVVQ